LEGNPFRYSQHTISSISGTEAFETPRDRDLCVVCGHSQRRGLDYCPEELIMVQWAEMKDTGFVPQTAKGVEHEARNGIRLCTLHQRLFDAHCYYIRWMPEVVF
ncbi:hypothetical protein JOM56_013335, partial [Amanita muscaria]